MSPLLNGALVITSGQGMGIMDGVGNGIPREMVRLDFGQYGYVDVPPELAMSFVSDQAVRDRIRNECNRSCRLRRENYSNHTSLQEVPNGDVSFLSPVLLASGG